MADVEISYKGSQIATMSASGVKTLLTGDTFCEDDIVISYTQPSAPSPTLQSKTVSPSTSSQTVTPDDGYDGLDQVTVNAMPSGSATTPATTITANPSISVNSSGLITASVSGSQSVTPTVSSGYVSSGTSGTITVSGSNTSQLTTQSAQTITPTTTNQTIASGKYLTGTQTILGDANLIAENIKKDVVIFGITGTYEGDVPSNYTVIISLTNPVNDYGFNVGYIYDITSPAQLGEITSATGDTTISVDVGHDIEISFSGASVSVDPSGVTCTAGITETSHSWSGQLEFSISASGTITIDGIDWDD